MPPTSQKPATADTGTREDLIKSLNGDLAREFQAIIAYVVYSQVLKGRRRIAARAHHRQAN